MARYRKKPAIIDALQWTGNAGEMYEFLMDTKRSFKLNPNEQTIIINTLEGEMTANLHDYIIIGVKGETYPCKPDIFEQTYEAVDG